MVNKRFENFINKAKIKFNDYYNYDEFNYVNNITKSIVTCPKHGNFEASPSTHISTSKYGGCKECRRYKKAFEQYYTKCLEAAQSCETKTEFMNKHRNLYALAHTYKWIDDICSHMKVLGNKYKRCVYSYEFIKFKTVYVGLTYDINNRDKQHRKNGPIYDFSKNHNIDIPPPIQKTDYLSLKKAIQTEGDVLNHYINDNWVILNKAKTGGLGGNKRSLNYTKEECFKIAKGYDRVSDCEKENYKVCEILRRNNWIESAFSHIFINNKIVCFNENGNFYKIYDSSVDASNDLALNTSNISMCLNKQYKFSGKYQFIKYTEWCSNNSPNKINPINFQQVNSKKVIQKDKDGNVLNKFNSISEVLKFINKPESSRSSISKACNGKLKTAYGYIWEFE